MSSKKRLTDYEIAVLAVKYFQLRLRSAHTVVNAMKMFKRSNEQLRRDGGGQWVWHELMLGAEHSHDAEEVLDKMTHVA